MSSVSYSGSASSSLAYSEDSVATATPAKDAIQSSASGVIPTAESGSNDGDPAVSSASYAIGAESAPAKTPGAVWKNTILLGIVYAFGQGSLMVALGTSVIAAEGLKDANSASIPFGLLLFFSMIGSIPASRGAARFGRRLSFLGGGIVGMLGGGLAVVALFAESFPLYCVALCLLGIALAFAFQVRFAALDIAPVSFHGTSLAMVTGATIFIGVLTLLINPVLRTLIETAEFAANYMLVCVYWLLFVIFAVGFLDYTTWDARVAAETPDERVSVSVSASASASAAVAGDESNEGGKVAVRTDWIPMKEWVTTPEFLVGASVQALSYSVMVFLMTLVPLPMRKIYADESDAGFLEISVVLTLHVTGMFLPSWGLTGYLIKKSLRGTAVLGPLILAVATALMFLSRELWMFVLGLFLVGVGWNLSFIVGNKILAQTYASFEGIKFNVQGLNEVVLFTWIGLVVFFSSRIFTALGDWDAVLVVGLAVQVLLLVIVIGYGVVYLGSVEQRAGRRKAALLADM